MNDIIGEINHFLLIVVLIVGLFRLRNIKVVYYFYIANIFLAVVGNITKDFLGDNFFLHKTLSLLGELWHSVLIYLFFTVTHLRKNKNIFLAILFTIFILGVYHIFINLSNIGYPNYYLSYIPEIILIIVLFHRLNSRFISHEFHNKISRAELIILISKIIYLLYDVLLGILMIFLFNSHTKQLFQNLYSFIRIISICSSILAIIALIIAPKRERYA